MRKGKLRACVLFFFLSEFIAEYCSIRYSKQLENFCIKFLPLFYEANMAHLSSCPSELPSYFILDSIGLLYLYSLFFSSSSSSSSKGIERKPTKQNRRWFNVKNCTVNGYVEKVASPLWLLYISCYQLEKKSGGTGVQDPVIF